MAQFIRFFIIIFFLLLFNFQKFESYEITSDFADKKEEQIIIDEDLLLVRNLNDRRDLNQRKSYYDTTMELGSGSPEVSTITSNPFTTYYFNSTMTTVITTTSEPSSSYFTSPETTEITQFSTEFSSVTQSSNIPSFLTTVINSTVESSTLFTSYSTSQAISLQSSTSITTNPTSQATSQRLIVSTNNYTSSEQTIYYNTTVIPTTPLPGLLRGNQDVSLLSTWTGYTDYSSYVINLNDNQIPLNLLGQSFTNLAIHPNGYVSFGNSIVNAEFPTPTVINDKIPIVAPFWFSSYFSSDTDIIYGRYDPNNMDFSLRDTVIRFINTRQNNTRSIKGISLSQLDAIYIITWQNLYFYSSDSNQKATFQLILASSFSSGQTFALFNYPQNGINWNNNDVAVFIGYTSGLNDNNKIQNMYSNTVNTQSIPSLIYEVNGNTNQLGKFVYDLRSGAILDACGNWYNNQLAIYSSVKLKRMVKCPTNAIAASVHPYYQLYTGNIWQSNSICYQLNTQVFFNKKNQQFCCYDTDDGTLNTDGFNAGFVYNSQSFITIIQNGLICCATGSKGCRKFYKIYPRTVIERSQVIRLATGTGDPQITTFDGLSYSFNGYGRFILSKAVDNSLEIQAETSIFTNVNDASIAGTFFNAFAITTNDSMIFEFRMNNNILNSPVIDTYVNKNKLSISNPLSYYSDFYCSTNTSIVCNSISYIGSTNVQVIFYNGLSINLQILTDEVSKQQIVTWMSITIAFIDTITDYTKNLNGLMGNNNGDSSDDISNRLKEISTDTNTDSVIYNYASTWLLNDDDRNLFYQSQTNTRIRKQATNYQPSFLQTIINKNPNLAQQANKTCNYNLQCVSAYLTSGLSAIGIQTRSLIQASENTIAAIALNPPSVSFQNSTVYIDWSVSNNKIIIVANVYSYGSNVLNKIVLDVSNANSLTNKTTYENSSYAVVAFTYYPAIGEFPIFKITVTDSKNLTFTGILSQTLICNCKSLDSDNTCLYNNILNSINPYSAIVACSCNKYYTGAYCNQTIDYCSLGNWCTLYPGFNTNIICSSYNVSMQKQTNLSFVCIGTCSSGFKPNNFGACEDIDECNLNATICPLNSNCVNQIGSYTCSCNSGYTFKNNTCQFLNYCNTSKNNCDSICNPYIGGFNCSCHLGYTLNVTTNSTCQKISTRINSPCDNEGCQQMCSNENGIAVCYCYLGYKTVSKTNCTKIDQCANGVCEKNCTNLIDTLTVKYYYNSFSCSCPIGYKLDADFSSCIICPFNTYGVNCAQTCQCQNSVTCSNTEGCICQAGYTGSDCSTPINLCLAPYLPDNSYNKTTTECESNLGYYKLKCLEGYTATSENISNPNCIKRNYCQAYTCPSGSTCVSLDTNFTCICSSGYRFDSVLNTCQDINECGESKTCPANCLNLLGNYTCLCPSGFYDLNYTTYQRNPTCASIDYCSFQGAVCGNQTCSNTNSSFECLCPDGSVSNGVCNSLNQTTQTTPVAVGLILSIVLPIGIVLILSLLAALVCYFWYKRRAENLKAKNSKSDEVKKSKTDSKWPFEKSMFQREDDDIDSNYLNTFQENYNDVLNGGNQDKVRSIYRSRYPFDDLNSNDPSFFKSLEDKMRSSQHTTITRPQSVFSDSSISLPTAYYETTTPYLTKNSFPQFINSLNEIPIETDEIFDNNNLDYDDDLNKDVNFEDLFDNDTDIGDFVEAYNPNVKIPRPKLAFNPMKLFNLKLETKPGESEQ